MRSYRKNIIFSKESSRIRSNNNDNLPKAYQQGWIEFYKLKFKVTSDVLIPRPETELLVDEVLKFARSDLAKLKALTILDIGTGTGNIAISLAKNLHPRSGFKLTPQVKIIATDISKKALRLAEQNAKLHRVSDQITFIQGNLLQNIPRSLAKLSILPDIIVTNLPYIPSVRIPYLDSSVKDFEPHIALDGGADGFQLYRKLFAQISQLKWTPRLIVGEIDYTHGQLALDEATKYFPQAQAEVKTDLTHKQRILLIVM